MSSAAAWVKDAMTKQKTIDCNLHTSVWEGEAEWFEGIRQRGWRVDILASTDTHVVVRLPIPVARVLVDRVSKYGCVEDGEKTTESRCQRIRRDQEGLLKYLEDIDGEQR